NWVIPRKRGFELARCLDGGIPLTVVATRIDEHGNTLPAYLNTFVDDAALLTSLRASCTIPLACGPPITISGVDHVDGALTESIPIGAASDETPRDARPPRGRVLRTRPRGELRRPPNLLERRLLYPLMNAKRKGLGAAHLRQSDDYAAEMRALATMDNVLV